MWFKEVASKMNEVFRIEVAMPAMPLGSIVRPCRRHPILIYLPPKPAMSPIVMYYHDDEWTEEQVCHHAVEQTVTRWNAFSLQQQEAIVDEELVEYQCALFCYETFTELRAVATERYRSTAGSLAGG